MLNFSEQFSMTSLPGSSPKSKGKGSGKKKTPEPEPEPEPEEPTGPPPPQPGSEEWEFVDQKIEGVSMMGTVRPVNMLQGIVHSQFFNLISMKIGILIILDHLSFIKV